MLLLMTCSLKIENMQYSPVSDQSEKWCPRAVFPMIMPVQAAVAEDQKVTTVLEYGRKNTQCSRQTQNCLEGVDVEEPGGSKSKTYSSRDSHVVTHRSTNLPFNCLYMAERTGCPVLS
jgi:hypothetical protein